MYILSATSRTIGAFLSKCGSQRCHSQTALSRRHGCIAVQRWLEREARVSPWSGRANHVRQGQQLRQWHRGRHSRSQALLLFGNLKKTEGGIRPKPQVNNEDGVLSLVALYAEDKVVNALLDANLSGVQERGCGALANLARDNGANGVSIAEAGGIPMILDAIRQHPNVPGVQERGCDVIVQLAFNNDANIVSIAKAGGIHVILDAIKQHANVTSVQERGCAAIGNLGINTAVRISFAKAGGITMLLDAMRQHVNVPSVQERGCAAIVNLGLNDDVNCVRLLQLEAFM